ncbi:allantoate permease [Amanita rubescens]|nr:allantoate permease [Amanita rubescens]
MMHVAHPTASSPSLQISPHNSSVPSLMTPHPNSKATRFISDVCIDVLEHPCRDEALQVLKSEEKNHVITEEENRRVLRKIDLHLMPLMFAIYFLQYMDKQTLSFSSVFGIRRDAHLIGDEYSWLGSILFIAEILCQPLSAYLLVRLPLSFYVPFMVTCWGATLAAMSAATNFKGLLIARFFLGGFESSVMASFVLIGQIWYRRQEQGIRIAVWYSNTGWGNIFGSLIVYGLGHIKSRLLYTYQIVFMLLGLFTFFIGILSFFIFPDNPVKNKFLNPTEKSIAIERIRANQQGLETKDFKFAQARETFLDIKSWCWMIMLFVIFIPVTGINVFGPMILQGLGFDGYKVMLLNIPFGILQVAFIAVAFSASNKFRMKSPALLLIMIPCIIGTTALLLLERTERNRPMLLAAYYILSAYTAATPTLLSWQSTNVAGHTKKTCTTALMTTGGFCGGMVGPLLFSPQDGPRYHKGLLGLLIAFCTFSVFVCVTVAYLHYLNRKNEQRRIMAGKEARIADYSMMSVQEINNPRMEDNFGQDAFNDVTDLQNDEFIYVY